MQTAQSQMADKFAPSFFSNYEHGDCPVAKIGSVFSLFTASTSFIDFVATSMDKLGYQYLFEMPGELFGDKDKCIAVVSCTSGDSHEKVYISYCPLEKKICIMNENEIPNAAKVLATSYSQLLVYFQSEALYKPKSRLH